MRGKNGTRDVAVGHFNDAVSAGRSSEFQMLTARVKRCREAKLLIAFELSTGYSWQVHASSLRERCRSAAVYPDDADTHSDCPRIFGQSSLLHQLR